MIDVLDRIERFTEFVPPSSCYLWTGAVANKSAAFPSPSMKFEGRARPVRRVVFELEIGEIPDDSLRVVVSCGSSLCIRPEHLTLATGSQVTAAGRETQRLRAAARAIYTCGHEAREENRIYREGNGHSCRECDRSRKRTAKRARAKNPRPSRWKENRARGGAQS